ncbi:MAG: PrpR N-terminal domain-containing protein [Butyrivibrio sp.]|uniref:PrpR N-terminal domain-containing protein n=1 Tax=Butyrivibrio sp. TaxID=28121 RepID=UPI0025F61914|nr:PrpR N-terminal domain-containing protein [Butyrivibrio sp.]MCR5772191.1 PrpR N-terminal domain-containing protein [Butyrivibrio sp.]
MPNIALLFPEEYMLEIVSDMPSEIKNEIVFKKRIETVNAISEARNAINAGADIIVARGYQHVLIETYTSIPTVAIKFQAQEVGALIKKAKEMIKNKRPCIGLIAFPNMLGNLDMLEELFDVNLHVITINQIEECVLALKKLAQFNVDLIIGGNVICEEAEQMGYPTLLYKSTFESIYSAIEEARRISKAIEIEKQNVAQFTTVMDNSFSGIIKINKNHQIIAINNLAKSMLKNNDENAIGSDLFELVPEFDRNAVDKVLCGEHENYTTTISVKKQSWILLIAPIQYDDKITGAIISVQKLGGNIPKNNLSHMDIIKNGFVAEKTFKDIISIDDEMKEQIELAKIYALSSKPVLIYSGVGNQAEIFAEAIHNNSVRKACSFVTVDVDGLSDAQQVELIFGDLMGKDISKRTESAIARANHGTLFIKNIDKLSRQAQSQLLRSINFNKTRSTDIRSMDEFDARIIALSEKNLIKKIENNEFNLELFYQLHGLTLEIPYLKDRIEDLEYYFKVSIKELSKQYNKYLKISDDAIERIKEFSWPGNIVQLRSFCERVVVVADKRTIDGRVILKTYQQLYPDVLNDDSEKKLVIYKEHEARHLEDLMLKYNGNRKRIANELGISTTTLWRKLKKLGIDG